MVAASQRQAMRDGTIGSSIQGTGVCVGALWRTISNQGVAGPVATCLVIRLIRHQRSPFPNGVILGKNVEMQSEHKYARVERERRFLLDRFPGDLNVVRTRRIIDRYIDGTTLRLREQSEEHGPTIFMLTQKVPPRPSGAPEGLITSIYLTQDEFCVLAQLAAKKLSKTRFSVPPFGIDVFEGTLEGLVLGEAEFDSAAAADALTLPSFIGAEVSADDRFTGGRLVDASRHDIQTWLLEHGIRLRTPD